MTVKLAKLTDGIKGGRLELWLGPEPNKEWHGK